MISHCDGDLHWLKDYTAGFTIATVTVMSKCGQAVVGAPLKAKIQTLPNVGRCDHSYAKVRQR